MKYEAPDEIREELREKFNNRYISSAYTKKEYYMAGVIDVLSKLQARDQYLVGEIEKSCHCRGVDFGTYKNVVSMKTPEGEWVCIDTCIATEIGYLWHQGVKTLNSCCGHGKLEPSVVVDEGSIEKMRELGYQNTKEKCTNPTATFALRGCRLLSLINPQESKK